MRNLMGTVALMAALILTPGCTRKVDASGGDVAFASLSESLRQDALNYLQENPCRKIVLVQKPNGQDDRIGYVEEPKDSSCKLNANPAIFRAWVNSQPVTMKVNIPTWVNAAANSDSINRWKNMADNRNQQVTFNY